MRSGGRGTGELGAEVLGYVPSWGDGLLLPVIWTLRVAVPSTTCAVMLNELRYPCACGWRQRWGLGQLHAEHGGVKGLHDKKGHGHSRAGAATGASIMAGWNENAL